MERGWAINIGGGFHHCSAERGGGFCAYADITLCIKYLFERLQDQCKKAMIVDLDAHQVMQAVICAIGITIIIGIILLKHYYVFHYLTKK